MDGKFPIETVKSVILNDMVGEGLEGGNSIIGVEYLLTCLRHSTVFTTGFCCTNRNNMVYLTNALVHILVT